MKKLLYFLLVSLFLISCSNNELTKEEAKIIIAQHYQLPFQTKIAINKKYDDYGWPPEKYRQLVNMGLISIHELRSFITRRYEISLTEKAREYWLQNGILNQAPEGNQSIIIFKGYEIDIKDVSVSSNEAEKIAEAEIILGITNISPIQQIFSPLESTEIKKTINFRLFDSGWKIVEDEKSKRLFEPISAPQHWAGGWKITFDNTPADIQRNLASNNYTVPISLDKLINKLGKSYNNIEESPSGSFYNWTFPNGLEVYASFGGSEQEEKKIFDVITFSAQSKTLIQNCPFGFVLNQTTFNEVNSIFNGGLKKVDYGNEYKIYSNRMWNYFEFKNNILFKVTIATWEKDMTS